MKIIRQQIVRTYLLEIHLGISRTFPNHKSWPSQCFERCWGIRKHLTKNLLYTLLCGGAFFIFFAYSDKCYFGTFMCENRDRIKGKLNVALLMDTALGVNFWRRWGNWNDNSVVSAAKFHTTSSNLKSLPPSQSVETGTEYPLEKVFQERKEVARNACTHILKTLPKENERIGVNSNQNVALSVGGRGGRVPKKTFYNQDMLQKMRLRNKPKYFGDILGYNKNRWIHFDRIIKSHIENKVVEIKWCPIFKAASSSWLAVFTKLSKTLTNSTEAQIKADQLLFLDLAHKSRLYNPPMHEKGVRVIKYSMVVVRHPFNRLLSAYRDKIERTEGHRIYYYNKYSTKILARYRKLDGVRRINSNDSRSSLQLPTFEEFVHYVLSTDPRQLDEHWRPMYFDCNPCSSTFDFILKVESLNDDKNKVMQYLVSPSDPQYKELEDVRVRFNNTSEIKGPRRNESFYFSQLTTADIQKLYELYEPDFQIFDYKPDEYFLMAREQMTPTPVTVNQKSSSVTIR